MGRPWPPGQPQERNFASDCACRGPAQLEPTRLRPGSAAEIRRDCPWRLWRHWLRLAYEFYSPSSSTRRLASRTSSSRSCVRRRRRGPGGLLRSPQWDAAHAKTDPRRSRSSCREDFSITILVVAKGNSRVLDCMRHDWQSATAPDLVTTSTVHNSQTLCTTLAATSDPDTQCQCQARPNGGHPSWGP
jgi:hypothetical protein